MNTAAYLTNQGWRGEGHALHHSGRGITKPIRISQKANVYGIGKKKHDAQADQWWARAFDDMLKGLNCTKDQVTEKSEGIAFDAGVQALQFVGRGGARWPGHRGLYSHFVRGESLSGTLSPEKDLSGNLKAGEARKSGKQNNEFENTLVEERKKRKKKQKKKKASDREIRETIAEISVQDLERIVIPEKPKSSDRGLNIESKEQRRQKRRDIEA